MNNTTRKWFLLTLLLAIASLAFAYPTAASAEDLDAGKKLEVEKKVSVDGQTWEDADNAWDAIQVQPDSPVHWQIKVENEGKKTVKFTIADVFDDDEVIVLADVCDTAPPTELAGDGEWTCEFDTTAVDGLHKNVVSVAVSVGGGTAVMKHTIQDAAYYQAGTVPPDGEDDILEVEKKVSRDGQKWEDADSPGDALHVLADSEVYWSISLENKTEEDLTVAIVDELDTQIIAWPPDCGDPAGLLLPAVQTTECKLTTTAALGVHVNKVTVTTEYAGEPVERSDSAYYVGMKTIEEGEEGCGQGYWKNHLVAWGPTGYAPTDSYKDVFGLPASFGDLSLLQALWQGGGSEMALGRKAVTALLNAVHPEIAFALSEGDVIARVQEAYASGNYEPVKDYLESISEGYCPLGNDDDGPGYQPGAGTPRFWREHQHIWPLSDLFVGQKQYTKQQALELMNRAGDDHGRGASAAGTADATYDLFSAVVAGQLNVAAGNDASCVSTALGAADEWLAANAVGSGVSQGDAAWQEAASVYNTLTAYNSGELCAPAVVDDVLTPSLFLPLLAGLR